MLALRYLRNLCRVHCFFFFVCVCESCRVHWCSAPCTEKPDRSKAQKADANRPAGPTATPRARHTWRLERQGKRDRRDGARHHGRRYPPRCVASSRPRVPGRTCGLAPLSAESLPPPTPFSARLGDKTRSIVLAQDTHRPGGPAPSRNGTAGHLASRLTVTPFGLTVKWGPRRSSPRGWCQWVAARTCRRVRKARAGAERVRRVERCQVVAPPRHGRTPPLSPCTFCTGPAGRYSETLRDSESGRSVLTPTACVGVCPFATDYGVLLLYYTGACFCLNGLRNMTTLFA